VVAGLIIIGIIAVVAHVGPQVLARWATVSTKLGGSSTVVSTVHATTTTN
jgi:Flp pilus assembly pilin Flp